MVIQVPEVLREKLGPEAAQALVDLLNQTSGRVRDDVVTLAEERFRRHLAEELALFRQEMAREFAAVRVEISDLKSDLRQEMAGGLAAVRVEIADVKADLTWRLFYFWTAHLVAIAGLLLAFFKLVGA